MTIIEQVAELAERFRIFTEQAERLKPDFEAYIKDREIPLEERWEFWRLAPDQLKRHDNWIFHGSSLLDKIIDNGCNCWGRGTLVDIADEICNIQENIRYCEEHPDYPYGRELTQGELNVLKEEMLSVNLGSFKYDW